MEIPNFSHSVFFIKSRFKGILENLLNFLHTEEKVISMGLNKSLFYLVREKFSEVKVVYL